MVRASRMGSTSTATIAKIPGSARGPTMVAPRYELTWTRTPSCGSGNTELTACAGIQPSIFVTSGTEAPITQTAGSCCELPTMTIATATQDNPTKSPSQRICKATQRWLHRPAAVALASIVNGTTACFSICDEL